MSLTTPSPWSLLTKVAIFIDSWPCLLAYSWKRLVFLEVIIRKSWLVEVIDVISCAGLWISQSPKSLPKCSHSRSMGYSMTIAGWTCLPEVLPQPIMVNLGLSNQPHKLPPHTDSIPFVHPRLSHISSNSPKPIAVAPSHELLALPEVQWMNEAW